MQHATPVYMYRGVAAPLLTLLYIWVASCTHQLPAYQLTSLLLHAATKPVLHELSSGKANGCLV